MVSPNPETCIRNLASQYFQTEKIDLSLLKGDGSDRKIFLVSDPSGRQKSVAGVYHTNLVENQDFIFISRKMKTAGIPVPEIYLTDSSTQTYLLQYLGKYNLGEFIDRWLAESDREAVVSAYQIVLPFLVNIQSDLTPLMTDFLKQRVMGQKDFKGDLDYFRRDFIQRFEFTDLLNDLVTRELQEHLLDKIGNIPPSVFVYRDFQSRNIMWWNESPWFIDYQSAFFGAPYYDLASLLFASKSGLDDDTREILLADYYRLAGLQIGFDEYRFNFFLFVLIRRLRSLGTYGFLSKAKGKTGFLASVGPGLEQMVSLLTEKSELNDFPHTLNMLSLIMEKWPSKQTQAGS